MSFAGKIPVKLEIESVDAVFPPGRPMNDCVEELKSLGYQIISVNEETRTVRVAERVKS